MAFRRVSASECPRECVQRARSHTHALTRALTFPQTSGCGHKCAHSSGKMHQQGTLTVEFTALACCSHAAASRVTRASALWPVPGEPVKALSLLCLKSVALYCRMPLSCYALLSRASSPTQTASLVRCHALVHSPSLAHLPLRLCASAASALHQEGHPAEAPHRRTCF